MINLLPDHVKRTVIRERRLRLLAVYFLMLGVVGAMLCVFLLPTTIWLDVYRSSDGIGRSTLNLVNQRLVESEKELATTKTVIDHLAKAKKSRDFSSLINELDHLGGDSIRLQQFVFDDKNQLLLSGVATSRLELSAFRDRLSQSQKFKKVELPLSDLAEDVNPPFTFTLTLK